MNAFLSLSREVDFVNETVRTLAGNGTKGSDYEGGGRGTNQACFHVLFNMYFLWNHEIEYGLFCMQLQ